MEMWREPERNDKADEEPGPWLWNFKLALMESHQKVFKQKGDKLGLLF